MATLGEYLPTNTSVNVFHMNGSSVNSVGNVSSTDVNMTYPVGIFNQCASFNGSSSRINFATTQLNTLTVSLWLNKTATARGYLYQQDSQAGGNDLEITSETNGLALTLWNGSTAKTFSVTGVTTLDGIWHNIIFTRDGAVAKAYIDGKFISQKTGMHTFTVGNYYGVIGCHNSGVVFLNGKVDEVIVENVVWSPEQIKKYYTNSLGRYAIL